MTVYAAYVFAGNRKCDMLHVCVGCAPDWVSEIKPLLVDTGESDYLELPDTCSSCGGKYEEDRQPLWLTCYPPKDVVKKLMLMLCETCDFQLRPQITRGSTRAPERYTEFSGGTGAPVHKPDAASFTDLPW